MARAVLRAGAVAVCALGLLAAGTQILFIGVAVSHVGGGTAPVRTLDTIASALSLGAKDLFTPADPATRLAVNAAVSATIWLLAAAAAGRIAAAMTTRRAAPIRAETSESGPDAGLPPADEPEPGDPDPRAPRAMKISRTLMVTVAVVATLETIGFGATYLLYSRHYVSTDNANIDGDKIDINAPTAGTVVHWTITDGSTVHSTQIVGRVQTVGSGSQPQDPIRAPGNGTVAATDVVDGSYVSAGAELATAYDLSKIYVTARVEDYDVGDVHPGAQVEITVDEFPHTEISGIVEVVQNSSAGDFTIYPPAGTADPSNPQRVDQYIPVKIELTNTAGLRLVPGMNASVHIRKG